MSERFRKHDFSEEDRRLRQALESMPLPLDLEAFQDRVLRRAQTKHSIQSSGTWMFTQEKVSWLGFAASLAAVIVFLFHFLWTVDTSPILRETTSESGWLSGLVRHYRAANGQELIYPEGSVLDLRDGSQVVCLSTTELSIALTSMQRQVHLAEGTIQIQAAKNESKPFLVHAHDIEIRVTGTQFIVSTKGGE